MPIHQFNPGLVNAVTFRVLSTYNATCPDDIVVKSKIAKPTKCRVLLPSSFFRYLGATTLFLPRWWGHLWSVRLDELKMLFQLCNELIDTRSSFFHGGVHRVKEHVKTLVGDRTDELVPMGGGVLVQHGGYLLTHHVIAR
ncbi:hypothetical protein PsorP6_014473 [Peronosclerospora sorghi]|uniref:Uncharacterized protein n=1 Tax=Peronosclerospora sorghi TaxID=230839 RepID=A0ACC0VTJ0_9STRA|nr:hypothetical protein PsorP6_014473 [Peronosclerospora sorghi]